MVKTLIWCNRSHWHATKILSPKKLWNVHLQIFRTIQKFYCQILVHLLSLMFVFCQLKKPLSHRNNAFRSFLPLGILFLLYTDTLIEILVYSENPYEIFVYVNDDTTLSIIISDFFEFPAQVFSLPFESTILSSLILSILLVLLLKSFLYHYSS